MSQSVKQSFESLIQAVKNDASNAQASFEVTSTLEEGVRVKNTVRGFEFGIDEPAVLGGTIRLLIRSNKCLHLSAPARPSPTKLLLR